MFKGPKSGRGSLAGTGLKVRVSGGFKRPSRQGMPSNGRTWPHNLEPDGSIPHLTAPSSTYVSYKPKRPSEMWKWIFSPLLPPFSFVLRARSFGRQNFFRSRPLAAPSRTLITHLDAGRRRERGAPPFDICFGSHCASCGERRCVAVVCRPRERFLSHRALSPVRY